jgi:hypothetical protein
MKIKREPTKLEKKARRGFQGYPVGTIAFYGPDASRASKVSVGIVLEEDGQPAEMKRWRSETSDVRKDKRIVDELLQFLEQHGVKSVVLADRLMGCPHEEGIDYPEGEVCPECTYWIDRDRFTGEKLPQQ